ncbi:MAG: hypothetical protein FWH02_02505 [Oscillospiraceae bacterium]|nr:hypothetical protein [Oscillospiraceae bacterium]
MGPLILCTIIAIFIFNFAMRPLIGTDKKAFWAGAVFLLSGYALLAVMSLGMRPPSFLVPVKIFVDFVSGGWVW